MGSKRRNSIVIQDDAEQERSKRRSSRIAALEEKKGKGKASKDSSEVAKETSDGNGNNMQASYSISIANDQQHPPTMNMPFQEGHSSQTYATRQVLNVDLNEPAVDDDSLVSNSIDTSLGLQINPIENCPITEPRALQLHRGMNLFDDAVLGLPYDHVSSNEAQIQQSGMQNLVASLSQPRHVISEPNTMPKPQATLEFDNFPMWPNEGYAASHADFVRFMTPTNSANQIYPFLTCRMQSLRFQNNSMQHFHMQQPLFEGNCAMRFSLTPPTKEDAEKDENSMQHFPIEQPLLEMNWTRICDLNQPVEEEQDEEEEDDDELNLNLQL